VLNRGVEPDINLMSRLAQGDERALEELYRRYSPSLYALLLRMLQSREEAEEILQDSFVQLYREAARYQPERGLWWLSCSPRSYAPECGFGGNKIDKIAYRTAFTRILRCLRLQGITIPETRSPQRQ
jgi:hypothetical protein